MMKEQAQTKSLKFLFLREQEVDVLSEQILHILRDQDKQEQEL